MAGKLHREIDSQNSTLAGGFNVEIAAPMSSSVVSEPPDIRNWFSTYTYQSEALDMSHDLGCSFGIKEGEDEEMGLYVEDSDKEDEERCADAVQTNCGSIIRRLSGGNGKQGTEIPVNTDSLSLTSEPPDIRNCFSSYVYESPALDSDAFQLSLAHHTNVAGIKDFDKEKEENLKELNIKNTAEGSKYEKKIASNGFVDSTGSFVCVRNGKDSAGKKNTCLQESNDSESAAEDSSSRNWSLKKFNNGKICKGNFMEGNMEDGIFHPQSHSGLISPCRKSRDIDYCVGRGQPSARDSQQTKVYEGLDAGIFTQTSVERLFLRQEHMTAMSQGAKIPNTSSSNLEENRGSMVVDNGSNLVGPEEIVDPGEPRENEYGHIKRQPIVQDSSQHIVCEGSNVQNRISTPVGSLFSRLEPTTNRSKGAMILNTKSSNLKENGGSTFEGNGYNCIGKETTVDPCKSREIDYGNIKGQLTVQDSPQHVICQGSNVQTRLQTSTELFPRLEPVILRFEGSMLPTARTRKKESAKSVNERYANQGEEKNTTIKRSVLKETTNFYCCDKVEIAGKWRCPQKSKPNVGPPLRQLRLEQWVHRV